MGGPYGSSQDEGSMSRTAQTGQCQSLSYRSAGPNCCKLGNKYSPPPQPLPVLQRRRVSLSPTPEQAETCVSSRLCRQVVTRLSLVRHLTHQPCSTCPEPRGLWPGSAVPNTSRQHFWQCPLYHHWLCAMI